MSIIYENYNERCWCREMVETIRKLILTSCLSLIGAEGRTYIGMAAKASTFYYPFSPIPVGFVSCDKLDLKNKNIFDSIVIRFSINSRMLSNVRFTKSNFDTKTGYTFNRTVASVQLVRYFFSLGKSLYGVYKNQQCNWECCVSVILSAQGGRANDGGVTDDNGDQDMETNQAQIDDVGVSGFGGVTDSMEVIPLGVENVGVDDILEDETNKKP
ncbi:unnamed protein product, partial [Porites lobata]